MTLTATHIDELLEKCRLGDQRAQIKVYNKYYKAMYNTSLRIIKHSAEAEDIMQESFLSAFSKLDSFKGDSTFGAWLKKIVINKSINAYNKRNKYAEVFYNDEFREDLEDDGAGIIPSDNEEDENPKVRKVLNALRSLKENYRIVLTLHIIEGYDYEEICEILDLSHANCRTTISRAKESLRNKLLDHEK